MLSHELAQLLLSQKNIPVVVPALNSSNSAELVEDIFIVKDDEFEPFGDEALILEGKSGRLIKEYSLNSN